MFAVDVVSMVEDDDDDNDVDGTLVTMQLTTITVIRLLFLF